MILALLFLPLGLTSIDAGNSAVLGDCVATVRPVEADGTPVRAEMGLRIQDGAGPARMFRLQPGQTSVVVEDLACGPSALEVLILPDETKWGLSEPLRLVRATFQFDESGFANVDVTVPTLRPIPCRVVDAEGRGVGGGSVGLYPMDRSPLIRLLPHTRVNADGYGELLVAPGEYTVTYSDDINHLDPTRVNGIEVEGDVVTLADGTVLEFVVARPPDRKNVSGHVVDETGQGIEGIDVATPFGREKSTTDSGGEFAFELPPRPAEVVLTATDRAGRWMFEPLTVDLHSQATADMRIVGRPWTGKTIKGRVLGEAGKPVVDVGLQVSLGCMESPPASSLYLSSAEDGRFEMPCEPGCPSVIDVYPYWSQNPEYYSEQNIAIPDSACGGEWGTVLERGASISGVVTDQHGHAIRDLRVNLVSDNGTVGEWTTGQDGSYRFGPLSPGSYTVRTDALATAGNDRYLVIVEEADDKLRPVSFDVGYQADLKRDLVAVKGGLICVAGIKLPGEEWVHPVGVLQLVKAEGASRRNSRLVDLSTNLSLEGGCSLGLPDGSWRVLAGAAYASSWPVVPPWSPTEEGSKGLVVHARAGQKTVVPASIGQPSGGVMVGLYGAPLEALDNLSVFVTTSADPESTAWVEVPPERVELGVSGVPFAALRLILPPGEYSVRVVTRVPEGDDETTWESEAVEVVVGEDAEVLLSPSS